MKERTKEAARYLRRVRRLLPCVRKTKNAIMQQIHDSMDGYLADHPTADFAQIKTQFGEPESVAAAYVESTGTAEILKSLRIRRRIVAIIAAVTTTALLIWTSYVVLMSIKVNYVLSSLDGSYDDSYIIEGTIEPNPAGPDGIYYIP